MPVHSLLGAMATTLDTIRSLPWAAHLLVALAMVSGLVLWGMGRQVLRPATMLLFAAVGGAVGLVIVPFVPMADSVGVLGGVLIGAAAGGVVGVLVYRFALAVGFGLVLGLAAPIAAVVLLGVVQPGDTAANPAEEPYRRSAARYVDLVDQLKETATAAGLDAAVGEPREGETARQTAQREALDTAKGQVKAFLGAAKDDLGESWDQLPARERLAIAVGGLGGLALGFLMGLALPGWAAGIATAMFGSAVWLASAVWLVRALAVPGDGTVTGLSARGWLLVWIVATAVGIAVQGRRAKRGKPGSAAGA